MHQEWTFCLSIDVLLMLVMVKECLKSNKFMFTYACATHAINNLCMDLCKHFLWVNRVFKTIMFMVKTFKLSHLLLKLFDKLCIEKYRKTYVLILFTKTRWGTVYYAAQRIKLACASLPSIIFYADHDIDISDKLKALIIKQSYWKSVSAMRHSLRQYAHV